MGGAIWDRFLTGRDREVFGGAGYGAYGALPERPALILLHTGIEAERRALARLACMARQAGIPVIHVLEGREGKEAGPDRPQDVLPESAASDIVLNRSAPSAFFETDLMGHLNLLRADGVILAGGDTSDAVRATVVDAFSLNLRSVVVADVCFDRWEASHALALFDLDAKHSNVMDSAGVRDWLARLPGGLFALPPGAQ
ncbi:MAG: isochorismatase family protein [Roseovarius pacificus]|nr:isochorismatase family protein [Roseovarius pacificus]